MDAHTPKKRMPLYIQIKDFIVGEIEEGTLKPNDMIYSGQVLQDKFKVSKITTEKALQLLLEEGVIYRIPGKGSFVSGTRTKDQVQENPRRNIAFVCPNLQSHHIMNILLGLEESICSHGHNLLLRVTKGSFSKQKEILRELLEQKVDGIVFYPVEGKFYDDEIFRMKLTHFPFVLVDKMFDRIDTSYVVSNNEEGSYLGTQQLLKKGHRKIAFFSQYAPASSSSIRARIRGFVRALQDAGIEDPYHWVFDSFDEEVGVHLTYDEEHREKFIKRIRDFIQARPGITAVLAVSPGNLSHVVRGLRAVDSEFVKQVELAIFDIDEYLDISRTPMLCINQLSRKIGNEAARIILNQIENPQQIEKLMLDMEIKTI
jgi:DNA-binding LacI/PurR family transcriptional regulator